MLLKKGAEANLYLEEWHNRKVIMKKRLPKKYRLPQLDLEIRYQRTINEPNIIHKAKMAGVPTPTILMVEVADAKIVMEFVEGKQIKEILDHISPEKRIWISDLIGRMIGRLHKHGIIHGDLTTSNMILTPYNTVVFVDFGLSERSKEVEGKGVDLHLMKRALQSTHYKHAKECFAAIMKGYTKAVGEEKANKVIEKIREIEKRGRYISER